MVGEWFGIERDARGAVDGDIGSTPRDEDVRRVTLADRPDKGDAASDQRE
jgi:hypothetical protein